MFKAIVDYFYPPYDTPENKEYFAKHYSDANFKMDFACDNGSSYDLNNLTFCDLASKFSVIELEIDLERCFADKDNIYKIVLHGKTHEGLNATIICEFNSSKFLRTYVGICKVYQQINPDSQKLILVHKIIPPLYIKNVNYKYHD